ncbi:MAG TPA: MFS transporter [Puia sp.]|nr:MFS transporter [Puia sp.]
MVPTILASSMAFIDSTALTVILPSLQQSLHATGADLFWVLNAYLLMLASLILIGGSLGDRLGRKKIYMVGILVFIIGSAACGLSPSVNFLIACRLLQGVGGALMIPGSLSLISSLIDEKERGKAIGTWSAITTVVTLGGPILGGALGDAGLWRYIFFINIPIGLAALLILWRMVPESKDEDSPPGLDIFGALSIALGLAALTFGCLREPALGLVHWQVAGSLIVGCGLLLTFVWIEKKSKYPMMPLNLFSNRTFTGTNLLSFFLYAGLAAAMLFLSLDLVQVQGYSQLQSGMTFLPFTLLMIGLSRFAGSLADRHGARWLLIAGPSVAGIGLLIISFVGQTRGPSDYWTSFLPGVLVFGIGMSCTVAPLTTAVMNSVSDRHSGTASGVNNATTRIANVFANAIFGAVAVLLFTASLREQLTSTRFNTNVKTAVLAEAPNLGNAKTPAGAGPTDKALIEKMYHESFIDAYGKIMRVSAGLAFSGALMAFLFIEKGKGKKTE